MFAILNKIREYNRYALSTHTRISNVMPENAVHCIGGCFKTLEICLENSKKKKLGGLKNVLFSYRKR